MVNIRIRYEVNNKTKLLELLSNLVEKSSIKISKLDLSHEEIGSFFSNETTEVSIDELRDKTSCPKIKRFVDFYDETGQITDIKEEIVTVYIRNFQTYIPFEKYLTEEYYYGDYTKMNTYLVNRYQIPLDLNAQIINPGINEIQYGNVQQVLDSLHGYLSVTEDAVNDLKVFPLDKLLASLEQYTIEFLSL